MASLQCWAGLGASVQGAEDLDEPVDEDAEAVVNRMKSHGVRAADFKADQGDQAQVAALVKHAARQFGRFGKPEEIAAAVAFLARPDASFVTGVALNVDGGLTS